MEYFFEFKRVGPFLFLAAYRTPKLEALPRFMFLPFTGNNAVCNLFWTREPTPMSRTGYALQRWQRDYANSELSTYFLFLTQDGDTPLHWAAKAGHPSVTRTLVTKGKASLGAKNNVCRRWKKKK